MASEPVRDKRRSQALEMKISKKWEKEREGASRHEKKKQSPSKCVIGHYIALYYIMDEENAKTPCHFNFKTLFFILILLLFVVKWILHRTNNTYLFHYGIFDDCRFDVRAFFILARYFLSTTIWILLFLFFSFALFFCSLFYVWFPLCAFVDGIKCAETGNWRE